MLTLYLLRHGQTDASRDRRLSGGIDARLSTLGHEMAQAFAESYSATPWHAIYSSPQRRALDTAAPLAAKTGMQVQVLDGLREVTYGAWEGILEDEVRRRWPVEYGWWAADPATRSTPGGETGLQVAARALAAIELIRSAHESGRVLVVSHKTTLRLVICGLLGIDLRRFRDRIAQPVASLSELQIDGPNALLKRLADVSHLPPRLRDLPGS
jgi:broad specificity phosphatase PhoE